MNFTARLSPESNIPSFRRKPESKRATYSLFFWIPAFAGMTKNGMIFSGESQNLKGRQPTAVAVASAIADWRDVFGFQCGVPHDAARQSASYLYPT